MDGLNLKYAKFLDDALRFDRERDLDLSAQLLEAILGTLIVRLTEEGYEWLQDGAYTYEPDPRKLLRRLEQEDVEVLQSNCLLAVQLAQCQLAPQAVAAMVRAGANPHFLGRDAVFDREVE